MVSRSPLCIALATIGFTVMVASTSRAALTTGSCLAQKRTAWGNLRKCQATDDAKHLKGKTVDPAKCVTKFHDKLAKINAKAFKAAIACRYGDNGDTTVTDYETGLQWEKKLPNSCSNAFLICLSDADCPGGTCAPCPHCVNDFYTWADAGVLVTGSSVDGFTSQGDFVNFAGHSDWRFPTISELEAIIDVTQGVCAGGSDACIDPIFGPTSLVLHGEYWSATTDANDSAAVWVVFFALDSGVITSSGSVVISDLKTAISHVRAVRPAL